MFLLCSHYCRSQSGKKTFLLGLHGRELKSSLGARSRLTSYCPNVSGPPRSGCDGYGIPITYRMVVGRFLLCKLTLQSNQTNQQTRREPVVLRKRKPRETGCFTGSVDKNSSKAIPTDSPSFRQLLQPSFWRPMARASRCPGFQISPATIAWSERNLERMKMAAPG